VNEGNIWERVALSDQLICIGKVLSPHGVKGEIKVSPYTDFPYRYRQLHYVRIKETYNNKVCILKVEKARMQGSVWILKLENVDAPEDAQKLKGNYLFILPEERFSLPNDTYYYDQIIGLQVYTMKGSYLGEIKSILPAGGQDTYLVKNEAEGGKYLIPAVKSFIPEVNLQEGRITIDPPEGLLDL